MRKMVASKVSFNEESLLFLDALQPVFTEWQTIADKFRPQLTKLLLNGDKSLLRERLHAACGYFVPLMQPVAQKIADHPCRCKNKADAKDFEPLLSDLFLVLHVKIHLMQSLLQTDNPSSESLLQARNTFEGTPTPNPSLKGREKRPNPKTPKPKKGPAKNEYKGSDLDDMAVEAMIHDMLEDGKPSPFLLDFIKMMRQKRTQEARETSQAGARWMVEDDLRLRELFQGGTPIAQIAREFNRTYGSIRARLKKLGLIE